MSLVFIIPLRYCLRDNLFLVHIYINHATIGDSSVERVHGHVTSLTFGK